MSFRNVCWIYHYIHRNPDIEIEYFLEKKTLNFNFGSQANMSSVQFEYYQ